VSTDRKFDRGFRFLTTEFVRSRLEWIDEALADPRNEKRITYLTEQREWWNAQLPYCWRREGLTSCPK
jgi:hypothetical protein